MMKTSNPLLTDSLLPPFSQIKPQQIMPALEQILTDNRQQLKKLLEQPLSWDNLMIPLDAMADRLSQMWSPVRHLHAVADSKSLRQVYNDCLAKLSAYYIEIGHNRELYEAFVALQESSEYKQFNAIQQKIIRDTLRDFKLCGVALTEKDKQRFTKLEQQQTQLQSQFEQHLLDSTENWSLLIEQKEKLAGLPEHTLQHAAQRAEDKKQSSGWLLTLDYPCYSAVMSYCQDREVRRQLYYAYVTRSSECGPDKGKYDNSQIIEQLLQIRYELAQLLGFKNYSDLSLAPKMAESVEEVIGFLEDLATRVKVKAKVEYEELLDFARTTDGIEALEASDIGYYSDKLRQHRFNFNQEQLRPWFPLEKVLSGMFALIGQLYGMRVEEQQEIDCWHPAVRFFAIYDRDNAPRGSFYIDLYAREGKRSGAWMDECRQRMMCVTGLQYPVAYLTCNFTPPVADKPSLLTHNEVVVLFHEFGHTLHHLLTQIDYRDVSGISGVPWDAVELPSQFFENFCWHEQTLPLISAHYETGEPLPTELQQQLLAAKQFQAGLQLSRQLVFALFDFKLHSLPPPSIQALQELLDGIRNDLLPMTTLDFNRFQHSFSHIFAGGYSAGYYSYLWAEVLAQDAFGRFLEEGVLNGETGQAFLGAVLEKGGSEEAIALFVNFRGRLPQTDALIKSYGID
ncbi:MAG: M3 family metallopeptidase [Gammaproteobacteria bacterium]|nr:M3 family metallopeptidase [Gammaproteobacteria bacterium]